MWLLTYLRERINAQSSLIFLGVGFGITKAIWVHSGGQIFNLPATLAIENFVPSTIALGTYLVMVCCVVYAGLVQVAGHHPRWDAIFHAGRNLAVFVESCAALGLGIYLVIIVLTAIDPHTEILPVRLSIIVFVMVGFFPRFVIDSLLAKNIQRSNRPKEKISVLLVIALFLAMFSLLLVFGIHPSDQCEDYSSRTGTFLLC